MKLFATNPLFRTWLQYAKRGKAALTVAFVLGLMPFYAEAQCPITTFPHTQNFDAVAPPAMPCGWTVVNSNGDTETWESVAANPSSAPNALMYSYNTAMAADDWVFSPSIAMNAANQYQVTFKYRARSGTFPEGLEVKFGTAATAAGMTSTLFTNTNITNATYNTETITITPTATGNFYLGFHAISLADMWELYIDDVTIIQLAACTGAPVAGTVPAGPMAICSGNVNTITATGATVGAGITYQWEEAASATGPWTNVTGGSGATTTTYTLPALTSGKFYRFKVTCTPSSQTATSSAVQVTINPPIACYCSANLHSVACSATDNINTVTIAGTTLNNANTGCSGASSYSAYPATGSTTATLLRQVTYNLSVTSTAASIMSVWIDYNQNGVFEATEWQQITTASTANTAVTIPVTIPSTAVLGQTGMRIRSRFSGNANGAADACATMGSGETEDYIITIGAAPTCTTPVTAGTIGGAQTVCIGQTVALTLTGQTLGTTLQWQSSPNGTAWTDITGATNATFTTPALSATTHYRVNVTCGASTVATTGIQVTVNTGAISTFPHTQNFDGVTAPALPCGWVVVNSNGDPSTWKSVASNPSSAPNAVMYNYNTAAAANDWVFSPAITMNASSQYVISFKYRIESATYPEGLEVKWGNAATAAGMTNTIFTNSNLTNITYATSTTTITPTAAGTYYLGFHAISAADMWNLYFDDVTITEIAACSGAPVAGTGPATVSPVCSGGTKTLTITGATVGLGITYQWEEAASATGPWANVTGGSGATTTSYTTPALTAGKFYRLKVTCANGGQTATTAALQVTVNNASITASSGGNRCGAGVVALSATPSAGATVAWFTAATGGAPVSTGNTYSPNVTATTTYYAAAVASGGSGSLDANPLVGGNGCAGGNMFNITPANTLAITALDLNLLPASGTSVPVSIYYKTGTYLGNEITASAWTLHQTVSVTSAGPNAASNVQINPLNLAAGQLYGIYVNADVNYTNITAATNFSNADLTLEVGSGLCSLFGGNNPLRAWNGKVYYTTGCPSTRVAVVATVNPAPTVNLGANISQCTSAPVVLNAGNAGATFQWSLNGTAISGATSQTLSVTTAGTYAVTVTAGGCSSTDDVVVTMGTAPAAPTITVAAGGSTTFCQGGSVNLTGASTTTGVTYRWSRNGTPIAGANTGSYTATQAGNYRVIATAGACSDSSAVTAVTVNAKPAMPTVTLTGNTLTASATTGTYQWFSVAGSNLTPVSGAISATFTPTVNGSYTVVVTVNGCASDAAAATAVVLGISSLAPGVDVSIFPNPTAGKFVVNLVGFDKEATIQVINVTGQVISETKVAVTSKNKTTKAFDLTGMAKGVYILKVTSGDNLTFRKVILD